MKKLTLLFSIVFCLTSSLMAQNIEKKVVQLSNPIAETEEYRVFGSAFDNDITAINLKNLIAESDKFDDSTVTTQGTIKQVCQMKGCFFILENETATEQARISFKDYSFFIPTNTAGSRVKLNGTFDVKTISEEDAKHYAEDAGEDPDAINGPQKEYTLTATSVVIYK
ncbi:MAG: DUF4920 domain-containing protein [Balneolaceae bacterium]|nr:DUF4920 domain-containing protein [Balneolaceae bacterium]